MIAGLSKNWLIAKGNLKPVYWLMVVIAVAGVATNIATVMAMPSMFGILSFAVLNVWAGLMGVKGLMRLKYERSEATDSDFAR
jgi:uncharacterized membrane protein